MMDGMMGIGWLASLMFTILLIAAVVWGVISLMKSDGKPAKIGLVVLAVVGGIALVAVLAALSMHAGMMGGWMNCCG
ncbi:MAG: hypothetical protein ACT4PS_12000 [Betaproteobacteria bacterium]